jgi:endonuclease/exonuclease/phosphatase (EEP) superfamily protein YafD
MAQHLTIKQRIDYIWYTGDFRAARAWVGPDAGSDHLPVLAKLVWVMGEWN